MTMDTRTIETLIEIIAREVLIAVAEQKDREQQAGAYCQYECAEDVCVHTCFDNAGQVVSAGAERLTSTLGLIPKDLSLASMIDHTLLKPDATPDVIAKLCDEARTYRFASVCVNPTHVAQCAAALQGSGVRVCTVAGFPLGATLADVKAYEARRAIESGAREVDMVINIGALKAGHLSPVRDDIAGVVETCHRREAICKVIIEAALLTDEEKVRACLVAVDAGADFVKTSTGFASGGAMLHDVALMRATVGPQVGVKAAGGIRDYASALAMVVAGANRIGASAGVAIVREAMAARD